jgi:subtilisin family serine protease
LASTNFWTNPGETPGNSTDDDGNGYVDDINGWDFVNSDAHPNDDNNHGTHVTGTIAQSTNNTVGVAGIAFNTTIMPIKVWGNTGGGTHTQTADGFYYAADNGAHIINYSGGGSHSITKQNAVAYARNAGVIIIAAAGNDYQTGNDPGYPAAYDDYVIAVGATRYDETRSYYSNTGSYLDIAAPGGDLTIDQNSDNYSDGVLQQTFTSGNVTDFKYYFIQGTSMATPHVAGVAALILAKHPAWNAAQVRYAIQSTATDKGTAGRDDEYGWGLIDALAALSYDPVLPTMEAIAEAQGQYYNTTPSFSNFGFDDDAALDDGWYQMDSYNGTWTVLFTDVTGTSWDSDNWTIPGFGALSQGSHTIYFKASDDDSNVEGESGEWSWQFYKDTVSPTDPTSVNSTSHTMPLSLTQPRTLRKGFRPLPAQPWLTATVTTSISGAWITLVTGSLPSTSVPSLSIPPAC